MAWRARTVAGPRGDLAPRRQGFCAKPESCWAAVLYYSQCAPRALFDGSLCVERSAAVWNGAPRYYYNSKTTPPKTTWVLKEAQIQARPDPASRESCRCASSSWAGFRSRVSASETTVAFHRLVVTISVWGCHRTALPWQFCFGPSRRTRCARGFWAPGVTRAGGGWWGVVGLVAPAGRGADAH